MQFLIHSKEKTPSQIFSFAKKFTKSKYYKPLVSGAFDLFKSLRERSHKTWIQTSHLC